MALGGFEMAGSYEALLRAGALLGSAKELANWTALTACLEAETPDNGMSWNVLIC
jgi:hypothetical protein